MKFGILGWLMIAAWVVLLLIIIDKGEVV